MVRFDICSFLNSSTTKDAELKHSINVNGAFRFISEKANKNLGLAIGDIEMGKHILFFTKSSWTVPELVLFILGKIGVADIKIVTWAIKEYPARLIVNALNAGLISNLEFVLDHRIKTISPDVYAFLQTATQNKVTLAHCHAKVTIIQNENWQIVITGSANYSKNPRGEAGTILFDKLATEHACIWFNELYNTK